MGANAQDHRLIGKTLNHYEIISQIGKGGMGEVYLARDTKLDRKVALKILPENLAAHPDRRARFEREAKAIASLKHPNIVTIYSIEKSNGTDFITMELVEGKPLTELIQKKSFPLQQILGRAISLSDALSSAHRKGITHRDIKPDNIMVDEEGRVKVLDFGLAKLRESTEKPGIETQTPTTAVTQEGKILGTVAYMSPEQAEGKTVDGRSDIFSLGVVLYEMATGQRPFKGDTHISMITSIIRDEPVTVTDLNQTLPRHLGRIVKRCLAKKPDRRYQSAVDLRNDLEELKEEIESGELQAPVAAGAARRSSAGKWIAVGFAGVLLLIAAPFLINVIRRGGPGGGGPGQEMEITRLTNTGISSEGTISPDGRYVAYLLSDAGQRSLWITQIATGSGVEVVDPSDDFLFDPIFSPDGDFIYYIRVERGATYPDLYRVPALGGTSRKVLGHVFGRVSFAPDGKRFVFLRGEPDTQKTHLVTANIDGSGEKILATHSFPDSYDDPVWSPDGETIAVTLFTFSGGVHARVVALPATGGEERPVSSKKWMTMGEMAWFPDGSGLVFTAGENLLFSQQIWEVTYPDGEARRVTNDLNSYHGAGLTADGKTLVTQLSERSFNIWVTAAGEGATPVKVTSGAKNDDGLGITWASADRILYGAGEQGRIQVRSVGSDGSGQEDLISMGGIATNPIASPDGEFIVFVSDRSGGINLWRSDPDGGNPVQLTKGDLDVDPAITPDGKWIFYLGGKDLSLYKIPAEGGEPVQVSDRRVGNPRISPDGTRIALQAWNEEKKKFLIDILPIEGGEPLRSLDIQDVGNFQWSPDGLAITYETTQGGAENIWNQPLDGGEPVQLTFFDADWVGEFAWSPDGKRIAVSRGRTNFDIVLLKNFR